MLFACVSNNKYGVGDILERERLELTVGSGTIKSKTEGLWTTLKETRPDHAVKSSVAITKLPLGRDILKNEQQNREMKCDFLVIRFFFNFLA